MSGEDQTHSQGREEDDASNAPRRERMPTTDGDEDPTPQQKASNAWDEGMQPASTLDNPVKEVREMDPKYTSVFNQGVLVQDGAAAEEASAPAGAVPLEGNSLNDLLRWSIANARDGDLEALQERTARGDFDPKAFRDHLDAMLGQGDLATMKQALGRLFDEASTAEVQVEALEEIEFLCEAIDNANDLLQVGGLSSVMTCLDSTKAGVAHAAAGVLATCLQNNAKCQTAAVAAGLVPSLLSAIRARADVDSALVPRLLYTLSACVRGHDEASAALLNAGGVPQLVVLARHGALPTRRRALFLLAALVRDAEGFSGAVRRAPFAGEALVQGLADEDKDARLHAVTCLGSLLDGAAVASEERVAGQAWLRELGMEDTLGALASAMAKDVAEGRAGDDEDPAVPLGVARVQGLLAGSVVPGPAPADSAAAPAAPASTLEPMKLTLKE